MAFSFFRWNALERLKDNLTEAQWDSVRAVAIVGGLAVAGSVGYWVGHPAWSHWQSRQALAQARAFAAKKDYPSMFLALRRATALAPRDRFVWEETARALDQAGSPEELTAREELTRLAPGDHALQLAFAQDALRLGRFDTARSALDTLAASGKLDLADQRVAVALAVAQGQAGSLADELAKLIRLEPSNTNARFTYAALRLWSEKPAEAQAAREEMEQLLAAPDARVRAFIELISEAARRGAPARVNQLIVRALGVFAPAVPVSSLHSEVQAWEALLRGLKAAAAANPGDAALLARWLADLRRPEALAWLESLPPAARQSGAVLDMTAQLAAEAKDDTTLRTVLQAGAWGAWPVQAWNRAIAHRQSLDRPDPAARPVPWSEALAACGDSLAAFRNLARLASAWAQPKDAEAAWLAVLDRGPNLLWAYQALRASYLARGDLVPLLSLYARWAEHFPLDDAVAEDWIMLAAVLDHTSAAISARAEALVRLDARAAIAKAALAWRRGRVRDAEKLLLSLGETDRSSRDGAFWMALVESDLSNQQAAAAALEAAAKFPRGPEETTLLRAAAKKVHLSAGH